jgi:hypothetical protein
LPVPLNDANYSSNPLAPSFIRQPLVLIDVGLDPLQSDNQIIPIVIGENEKTLAIFQQLRDEGIMADAIRLRTVPEGTARLRLSVLIQHVADFSQKSVCLIRFTQEMEPFFFYEVGVPHIRAVPADKQVMKSRTFF